MSACVVCNGEEGPVCPRCKQLADIGMTALVDEATGYQAKRPKDELRKMAKKPR